MNTIGQKTDLYFKYVPHRDVQDWEKLGWFDHHSFKDTHHGRYSTLMQWQGVGDPVVPNSEPVEPQS